MLGNIGLGTLVTRNFLKVGLRGFVWWAACAILTGPALAQEEGENRTPDDSAKLKRRIQELEATRDADADAEAQSQRLMSAGFTLGYALAFATGTPWRTNARMVNAQTTSMPYLLVLPAYWGKPKALRDYCAAAWIGGDEYAATRAAMIVARRAANELVQAVKASIRAGLPAEQTYYELLDVTGSLTNATVIYRHVQNGIDANEAQEHEDRAIGQNT
jgi:hypothetical protein